MYYEKLIPALVSVGGDAVSHAEQLKKNRYIVWDVDNVNDLIADGSHVERAVRCTVDLFTKTEFDEWAEDIETALDGFAWEYNGVDYEEETGFFHHQWSVVVYG